MLKLSIAIFLLGQIAFISAKVYNFPFFGLTFFIAGRRIEIKDGMFIFNGNLNNENEKELYQFSYSKSKNEGVLKTSEINKLKDYGIIGIEEESIIILTVPFISLNIRKLEDRVLCGTFYDEKSTPQINLQFNNKNEGAESKDILKMLFYFDISFQEKLYKMYTIMESKCHELYPETSSINK